MNNVCPFGSSLQKYWDRRHTLFARFDEGIQIDGEGLYSVCPEDVALAIAERVRSSTVFDAFGGVGGNSIAFARKGKIVWFTDINAERVRMAKANARIYSVEDKITFLSEDFFVAAKHVSAGAVYIDPPWGGPSYSQKELFSLRDFSPDGVAILQISFQLFPEVILRVPSNFDMHELQQFDRKFTVEENHSAGKLISKTVYFSEKR